jgi:malate dehydrogenase (oxaloacetate-decarboxylating)(NADP+)
MFFWCKPENIVMFNSKGALKKDDPTISEMQRKYATIKINYDLAEAL